MKNFFSMFIATAILGVLLNSCNSKPITFQQPATKTTATLLADTATADAPDIGKCLTRGIIFASNKVVQHDTDVTLYESWVKVTPEGEDALQVKPFSFVKGISLKGTSGKRELYYMVCPKLVWGIWVRSDGDQGVTYTSREPVYPDSIKTALKSAGFELVSDDVLKNAPTGIADYIPEVHNGVLARSFQIWGQGASKKYIVPHQEPEYRTWDAEDETRQIMMSDDVYLVKKI